MSTRCFLIEDTHKTKRWLRRYTDSSAGENPCPLVPGKYSYHNSMVELDVLDHDATHDDIHPLPHDDPRWVKVCACGYEFQEKDQWQVFTDSIYKRADTGDEFPLRNAPVGSMWWALWLPKNMYWDNKEDDSLCVKLPDGTDWNIDSRCNNCALPNDRTHRCWGRMGTPPNVTAGKIGATCPAGGGSIQSPNWHGHLVNGELIPVAPYQ
jgi:hypothetical protein